MSFLDDLQADLENVFYQDVNHKAVINGSEITGYLDVKAWRWRNVDANQKTFSFPAHLFTASIERGAVITVNNRQYRYVRFFDEGDTKILVLE
ncbi:hypothetical protein MAH1_33820 [Sessilibacter sp. MAH1]